LSNLTTASNFGNFSNWTTCNLNALSNYTYAKVLYSSNTAMWASNVIKQYIDTDSNGGTIVTTTSTSSDDTKVEQSAGKDEDGGGFVKFLFSSIGGGLIGGVASASVTMGMNGITVGGQSLMQWGTTGVSMLQNAGTNMAVDLASNAVRGLRRMTTQGGYEFMRTTGTGL
jgi:hypothetical protein